MAKLASMTNMPIINSEIVKLYSLGLTVSDIVSEVQLSEAAVRAVLEDASPRYIAELAQQKESSASEKAATNEFGAPALGLRKSDREDMLEVIRSLAHEADNDSTRLRAATFIVDEHAGRHDAARRLAEGVNKGLSGLNISVLVLNEGLNRLRNARTPRVQQQPILIDAQPS